jgi:dTDP-4-dehydrorhamnose reductase
MKILLTGAGGQVGSALAPLVRGLGEVRATGRRELDLASADAIRAVVREVRPDVIVNAAAYTAVDQAESDAALAFAVNAAAPGVLAEEAKKLGALLVHYSTDYVFDGEKGAPYLEEDPPRPLSVYGESKLAGERAVRDSGCRHLILRTSWIYSGTGRNFLLTILRRAREGEELRVVDDQLGAPTSAHSVAEATAALLRSAEAHGTFHMTAGGETSWHGFAGEIAACAGLSPRMTAIRSAEFARPARRPRDSRLDSGKLRSAFGIRLPEWREDLRACLAGMDRSA